jgi:SAM-dependent methyltransferase
MISSKNTESHQWYANIFDDMGSDWEAIVNRRDTFAESNFIETVVPTKRKFALDLCCGTGRHSVLLRKKGWNTVGMDLSRKLLLIAKSRMRKAKVSFPLIRAEMRNFPFRNAVFEAIINMFTSFGYLPSQSEDMKSLFEIARTLKRNGKFLLDISNLDHMIRIFRETDWAEFEPFYLLEKRSLDLKTSRLISDWIIIQKQGGKVITLQHKVRLYTFPLIEKMLEEAGLMVEQVYGGYDKKEFNLEASRMIVKARKR